MGSSLQMLWEGLTFNEGLNVENGVKIYDDVL